MSSVAGTNGANCDQGRGARVVGARLRCLRRKRNVGDPRPHPSDRGALPRRLRVRSRPPPRPNEAGGLVLMNDRLLTASDVAERLSVPETWVREQARAATIPHLRLGRYV